MPQRLYTFLRINCHSAKFVLKNKNKLSIILTYRHYLHLNQVSWWLLGLSRFLRTFSVEMDKNGQELDGQIREFCQKIFEIFFPPLK